jgi:hypothetical protein
LYSRRRRRRQLRKRQSRQRIIRKLRRIKKYRRIQRARHRRRARRRRRSRKRRRNLRRRRRRRKRSRRRGRRGRPGRRGRGRRPGRRRRRGSRVINRKTPIRVRIGRKWKSLYYSKPKRIYWFPYGRKKIPLQFRRGSPRYKIGRRVRVISVKRSVRYVCSFRASLSVKQVIII